MVNHLQHISFSSIEDALKSSKIRFQIAGSQYKVAVERFHATEKISAYYEVSLWLVSENEISANDVIRKTALLTVASTGGDRYFNGIICQFMQSGRNGRFFQYQAKLVPSLWLLTLNQDCRIFQNLNSIDIVRIILEKNGMNGEQFEIRGIDSKAYQTRRYCVQYRETDLTFISRLLEEEGIFFFFEHSESKHKLVFSGANTGFKSINHTDESSLGEGVNIPLEVKPFSGQETSQESVRVLSGITNIYPGKFTQTAFNFKMPSAILNADCQKPGNNDYEIYDFPCDYGKYDHGKRLTMIRYEEQITFENMAVGSSNCPRLAPGYTFKISGHDLADLNQDYLVVLNEHNGSQFHVLGENAGIGGDYGYSNEFMVIPSKTNFRPGRSINKPHIIGMQTATVVGKPEDEIYTDEYGRVKVLFHWDRLGKEKENREDCSCWVRCVQAWGGNGWGTVFTPRVGDEVLISFMDGDPDWPIIVGSVYNGANMPLYHLPEHMTRSVIRTRSTPKSTGFNELRFEDRAGSEEIFMHGEKDWNIVIKNDKTQSIGHDESLSVGNNRTKSVGVNQSVSIGANKSIQVGINHSENIGANMNLSVGANKNESVGVNSSETVGAAKELTVGGLYQVTVGAVMNETVGADKSEEVIGLKAVVVGMSMQEYVKADRKSTVDGNYAESIKKTHSENADEYILEANKITLKAGASTIVMDGSSITLKSPKIFTN